MADGTKLSRARDRRRAARIPLSVDVRLAWGQERGLGRTTDISMIGLFVRTDSQIRAGTTLALRLYLEGHRIDVVGQVARAVSAEAARRLGLTPGLGIVFTQIMAGRAALALFIEEQIDNLATLEP